MSSNDDPKLLTGDLALISKHRNALMGIAAVIICVFHEFLPILPEGTIFFDIEEFVLIRSFYGVDIFLILSGMSVVFSLCKDPRVLPFYGRRAVRILPVYLLSGLVMMITEGWSVTDYLLNISGVRFFTTDVNSYLWFVPTIILFYLAAPWYQKLMSRFGRPVLLFGISFAVWFTASVLLRDVVRGDLYYMINRIPIFLLGMLIGNLIKRGVNVSSRAVFWTAVISLFIIGWFMAYANHYYGYLYLFGALLEFVPTFALGTSVAYICAGLLELLKWKWLIKALEFVGSFCFEFYIIQRLFDAQLMLFISKMGFTGIVRNLLMFLSLGLISFAVSRIISLVIRLCKKKM